MDAPGGVPSGGVPSGGVPPRSVPADESHEPTVQAAGVPAAGAPTPNIIVAPQLPDSAAVSSLRDQMHVQRYMLERVQDELKDISESLKGEVKQPIEVRIPGPEKTQPPKKRPVTVKKPVSPPKPPPEDAKAPKQKRELNKLLREKGQASNLLDHLMKLTDHLPPPVKEQFDTSRVRNKMQNLIQELADRRREKRGRRTEDPNAD